MSRDKNFAAYRQRLKSCSPPCVPFMGIFLSDLTFLREGNSDRHRNDPALIHFKKFSNISRVLRDVVYFQSRAYNFHCVAEIQMILSTQIRQSRLVESLLGLSYCVEPHEPSLWIGEREESIRVANLMAERGFL